MNKKILIGVVALFILAGVGGGAYFAFKGQEVKNPSFGGVENKNDQILTTYKDPNLGFVFEYPNNLTVNPHEEDKEN